MPTDMKKRKFSKEDKLQIIKEASEQGVKNTLEKHGMLSSDILQLEEKV